MANNRCHPRVRTATPGLSSGNCCWPHSDQHRSRGNAAATPPSEPERSRHTAIGTILKPTYDQEHMTKLIKAKP